MSSTLCFRPRGTARRVQLYEERKTERGGCSCSCESLIYVFLRTLGFLNATFNQTQESIAANAEDVRQRAALNQL